MVLECWLYWSIGRSLVGQACELLAPHHLSVNKMALRINEKVYPRRRRRALVDVVRPNATLTNLTSHITPNKLTVKLRG